MRLPRNFLKPMVMLFYMAGTFGSAMAANSGPVLQGTSIPGHVFMNKECMATLITPHVLVTSGMCTTAASGAQIEMFRAFDRKRFVGELVRFTEVPKAFIGDIAVVILTEDAAQPQIDPTLIIPSYNGEDLALSEPEARKGKSGYPYLQTKFAFDRLPLYAYLRDTLNADVVPDTFKPSGLISVRRSANYIVPLPAVRKRRVPRRMPSGINRLER